MRKSEYGPPTAYDLHWLARLASEATPGQWYRQNLDELGCHVVTRNGDSVASDLSDADAGFVALADPDMVLSLVERIEELERELKG